MGEMPKRGVLIVMVGPPGCGKSTEAARLASEYGYSIICPDTIRKELYGDETIQGDPAFVFDVAFDRVRNLLEETGVIFDATNCRRKYRQRILDETEGYRQIAIARVMTSTLEECLRNNTARQRKVPEGVIESMYRHLREEPPRSYEGFDVISWFGPGSSDSKVKVAR